MKDSVNERLSYEGKFNDDSLEIGHWKYFNKENFDVVDEGLYTNGIRSGLWKYYFPDSLSINWREFSNASHSIRTNIPEFLALGEQEDNLLKFTHKDSSNVINLIIGRNFMGNSIDFQSYQKTVIRDLVSRNVNIIDSSSKVYELDKKNPYLFSFLFIQSQEGKSYYLLSILGNSAKGEPIEIGLSCEPHYLNIGRKVFFSVLGNIFFDSKRFFPVKEGVLLHNI